MNTVTLSLNIYNEGKEPLKLDFLVYFNYIFFAVFLVELILKMIGFGCREFIKDKFNIFDAFVVLISLVEIILAGGGDSAYSSLRAFRLFRIFKIFRVGSLRTLIDCLTRTMKAISPFVICLCLFMFIFSLMGMQFFGGKLKFDHVDKHDTKNGTSIRYNFDTFPRAFLSVFIILTGENWNEMMYDSMRATSNFAAFYFIIVIVWGNFIILQLLVAIVINNFDESRKLTEKRKIIDEVEFYIELGNPIIESIQKVLGKNVVIQDDEENLRGSINFSRKKTQNFKRSSIKIGTFIDFKIKFRKPKT
jgi:hypothetical protein